MTQRQWNKAVLTISAMLVLGVFSVNVFIDSANIFKHSHSLNRWKTAFDERLQKTSYLTHRSDIEAIDTLLFGSSRNTYYDQENFASLSVFNYAFSNGNPEEYVTFLNYAKTLKDDAFSNIIIGLDFVGYGFVDKNAESNARLINDIQGSFFLAKYVSLDMAFNSLKTVVSSVYTKLGTRVYDNNNNTYISRVDPQTTIEVAERLSEFYYSRMVFDEGYFDALKEMRSSNPETKFIIFTNPVSAPFLRAIYSDHSLKDKYFHWIREIVDIFGEVYFFTYPNEFSKNYMTLSNDGSHYYKETLITISNVLQSREQIDEFGLLLEKENLEHKLSVIRRLAE